MDMDGYDAAFKEHQEASKGKGSFDSGRMLVLEAAQTAELADKGVAPTDSSGKYTWHSDAPAAKVMAIFAGEGKGFVDATSPAANDGDEGLPPVVGIVLDKTSFYAEQGGQAADKGAVLGTAGDGADASFDVENCLVYAGFVLHIGCVSGGTIRVGDEVRTAVDYAHRDLVAPNHTCTHLLNFGL